MVVWVITVYGRGSCYSYLGGVLGSCWGGGGRGGGEAGECAVLLMS